MNVAMALRVSDAVPPPVPPAAPTAVIAVADNGTNRVIRSIDGGLTFSPVSVTARSWIKLAFSPTLGSGLGRVIAVADTSGSATTYMYSDDLGETWTLGTFPINFNCRGVAWSPTLNLFLVTASTGGFNPLMTSPTGLPGSWTNHTISGTGGAAAAPCIWHEGFGMFLFLIGGDLWRCADGSTFTRASGPTGFSGNSSYKPCATTGRFLEGQASTTLNYTTGPTTARSTIPGVLPGTGNLMAFSSSLGTGNGRVVVAANTGANPRIQYSDNLGTSFTAGSGYDARAWTAVTRSEEVGLFFAASSSSGNNTIARSADGISWENVAAPSAQNWRDIIVCDGLAAAV